MTERFPLKLIVVCVLFSLVSLAASLPVFGDELSILTNACPGQTVTSGGASVTCTAAQTGSDTATYFNSGNLSTGIFTIGASTFVVSGCVPTATNGGCGIAVSTATTVTYNFGGLGVSSGTAHFNFTATGTLTGSGPSNVPNNQALLFEASAPESLSVNGGPLTTGAALPSGISKITVITPITNGTATLQFNLLASATTGGDGGQSVANFSPGVVLTGASTYDANANLVPGVTFVSESGFNPNAQATYRCQGFQPPFTTPISIQHQTQRAIPLTAQLFDSSGNLVTPTTLGSAQAPVVDVIYTASIGTGVNVTDELDPVGHSSSGNTFNFDPTSNTWWFNLNTGSFTASGTYSVTLQSGDVSQYSVSPQCSGTFVRQ